MQACPPKIGLALLTYNSARQLTHSWSSYLQTTYPLNICVVDNASTDNTVPMLREAGVPVHVNEQNTGYSAGMNQCLQMLLDAGVDWLAVVNPDVILSANWDEAILSPFTSQDRVGIIGTRLVSPSGGILHTGGTITKPSLVYWPTRYQLGDNWGIVQQDAVCVTRFRHRTQDCKDIERVPWVTFACVMLRASMLREIGLLDTLYFLYSSDAELCMRANEARWEIWYNPVTFVHEGSASVREAGSDIQQRAIADLQQFALREGDYLGSPHWSPDSLGGRDGPLC